MDSDGLDHAAVISPVPPDISEDAGGLQVFDPRARVDPPSGRVGRGV
jgi:hypothetical protein